MPEQKKSELVVVTKAKELCAYVMTITQKSPKQLEISRLLCQREVLHIIIDTIIEQDEAIVSVYYR